jgi:hypothetical protein
MPQPDNGGIQNISRAKGGRTGKLKMDRMEKGKPSFLSRFFMRYASRLTGAENFLKDRRCRDGQKQ